MDHHAGSEGGEADPESLSKKKVMVRNRSLGEYN